MPNYLKTCEIGSVLGQSGRNEDFCLKRMKRLHYNVEFRVMFFTLSSIPSKQSLTIPKQKHLYAIVFSLIFRLSLQDWKLEFCWAFILLQCFLECLDFLFEPIRSNLTELMNSLITLEYSGGRFVLCFLFGKGNCLFSSDFSSLSSSLKWWAQAIFLSSRNMSANNWV